MYWNSGMANRTFSRRYATTQRLPRWREAVIPRWDTLRGAMKTTRIVRHSGICWCPLPGVVLIQGDVAGLVGAAAARDGNWSAMEEPVLGRMMNGGLARHY